jgi:peptide/nickel transport system substrate-binding protein
LWRSRKVVWLAALLAFALIAAACGGDDDTGAEETTTTAAVEETTTTAAAETTTTAAAATTTEAEAGKQYGGEAIAADDQEPPTLNPFVPGGDNFIVSIIGQSYFTGVYEIDGFTLELIPELVTELPTVANGGAVVNDDGTFTVTYTIRDDAQWSDGTPVSGDDFQFTLDTILNPDLPVDKATYDQIVSTDVGPKSFTYTLAAPTPLFELIFSNIIPKHAVEGSDFLTDWNETMWPSSGPFIFDTWQKGEFLTVVRNDNYWKTDPETGQQLPYLDSVTWRFIPETESIITAFRGREVDVIQPPPATETIEALQALEPEGAVVEVLSGPVWEHLNFQFGPNNRNEGTANANLNYRKCVAHLVNKQLIVDEILAGQVEPLDSFVEAFTPSLSQGSWAQYDYNVEGAQAFCDTARDELGVDSIPVVFSTTSNNDARVKLSELFVDMFGAVDGLAYENDLEDSQLFFGETLDNGTFDLGEWAWVGSPGLAGLVSIMDVWDPENPCPEGSNCYQWGTEGSTLIDDNTARFAEIRDELNASVDEAVLLPLINEAENILADQVVLVPLYARLVTAAYWGDELGGVKHNSTQAGYTWNIEDWYRIDL